MFILMVDGLTMGRSVKKAAYKKSVMSRAFLRSHHRFRTFKIPDTIADASKDSSDPPIEDTFVKSLVYRCAWGNSWDGLNTCPVAGALVSYCRVLFQFCS